MRTLAESDCTFGAQIEHGPTLVRGATRFVNEGESYLAILLYATAVEHWVNGMLETGMRRQGNQLTSASERGTLALKLDIRWLQLLGSPFPSGLRDRILQLAEARNDFVHYKWPSLDDAATDDTAARLCREAPALLCALANVEDDVVFDGQRTRLETILVEMGLGGDETSGS